MYAGAGGLMVVGVNYPTWGVRPNIAAVALAARFGLFTGATWACVLRQRRHRQRVRELLFIAAFPVLGHPLVRSRWKSSSLMRSRPNGREMQEM